MNSCGGYVVSDPIEITLPPRSAAKTGAARNIEKIRAKIDLFILVSSYGYKILVYTVLNHEDDELL
jgi:hypothetical protein